MVVYLCGGINGLSDADCKDWREAAKSLLTCDTLDPMRHDYRGIEDRVWTEIVAHDLADIQNSDAVLVNATRPSWGTAMEIVYARNMEKPVVAFVQPGQPVSPWLKYHCSVVESLEDACALVEGRE
jgi:nucleoside 2-deoxyribosyltransferase